MRDVLAHDHILRAAHQIDALALAARLGLDNKSPFLVELLEELGLVLRQQEGLREEVVLRGEGLLEARELSGQQVLAREHLDAREVVDLLMRPQLGHLVERDGPVGPDEVAVANLPVALHAEVQRAGHPSQHLVLAVAEVDHDFSLFALACLHFIIIKLKHKICIDLISFCALYNDFTGLLFLLLLVVVILVVVFVVLLLVVILVVVLVVVLVAVATALA